MSDNSPQILPYAVRPKTGMALAGVGHSEFYKRINSGLYQSYLDGSSRFVVTESILAHQRRLAKEQSGTPATKPSKRHPGRPKKA
jgi:hypothetical protein